MTFLVNGVTLYGEPGVFMSFEETADDLAANVASLGYDVPGLIADKKLVIDHVRVERSEIEETGDYDLEGLFVRLDYAIKQVGAKRVVLDTIEALFSGLDNTAILRAELRRLFGWLKERGVTAVITAERGDGQLTRHGLEEYVSDCVILLDNRVVDQITTRRLRVVKYRGSAHGTNEYPFLDRRAGYFRPSCHLGGPRSRHVQYRRVERHPRYRRHARRRRLLLRIERARHGLVRYRQDHLRRAFHGCGVPARRTLHLLRL